MYSASDLITMQYLTTDHEPEYHSSSTPISSTMPSWPSLVSDTTSSPGSWPSPKTPSTPSTSNSCTSISGTKINATVPAKHLLARRSITWAALPEKPCSPAGSSSNTTRQQETPSRTQHQRQTEAVNRGRSRTIRCASASRTKAHAPAKTTSKIQNILTILQYAGETTPTRAGRRSWKQPVQPLPQHQRQSNLTALIQGNKAKHTASGVARQGILQGWIGITACSYGELRQSCANSARRTEEDEIVTTTTTSSSIDIPLDRWGQPNHHLAAKTTWKDGGGTKYLADGTEAPMTVNSCGERMPVEIATWGDYWGNHTLRYEEAEEVEDWNGDYQLW